ncbi:MAG: TonB C-terminal domain-containing protein [Desulfobacterales bacterium]
MDDLAYSRSHFLGGAQEEPPAWRLPLVLSVVCHFFLFAALVFVPAPKSRQSFSPSVISVDLVSVAEPPGAEADAAPAASESSAAPAPKAPETVKSAPAKTIAAKVAPKPEVQTPVPVQPPAPVQAPIPLEPPKPKASLKQQTFQSEKVLESALAKIEKTVETSRPDPLAAAFERLRQQVDKSPAKGDGEKAGAAGASTAGQGKTGSPGGGGGKEVSSLEKIYRYEIASRVQEKWNFVDQLAGSDKNIRAWLVFKVMPNGEIRDIFFTERSGNAHLDDSAYKAIVKSNPVDPHPPGLRSPYIEMGLRIGPEGLQ